MRIHNVRELIQYVKDGEVKFSLAVDNEGPVGVSSAVAAVIISAGIKPKQCEATDEMLATDRVKQLIKLR